MKRMLLLLLALLLALSLHTAALGEDGDDWDWRANWEEWGYFDFCDVQDNTLIIFEGVKALGVARTDSWDEDLQTDVEIEPAFVDGPSFAWDADGGDFHRVSLPSTLRYLGVESFCYYDFEEFTLPAQLEILESYAFYRCTFDALRIETVLPADEILNGLEDCSVAAYDVPEDHPLYKTVDGVLFSKDGKTLLAYPNARTATHYDVPAGVERIGDGAFGNENLKTISLPIGLKSIGDYGFGGCTRLQSIALPLTVREIGKEIFADCVSLELVSLPEGLEAEKAENNGWVEYYPDDAHFRGDNGDTLAQTNPRDGDENPSTFFAAAATLVGQGESIPLFETSTSEEPIDWLPDGMIVFVQSSDSHRLKIAPPLHWKTDSYGWVEMNNARCLPTETLFLYFDILPAGESPIWTQRLPDPQNEVPAETRDFSKGFKLTSGRLFGPFVVFQESEPFACRIQDCFLTAMCFWGDETKYGILYSDDPFELIPLKDGPDGETICEFLGGTQVEILSLDESGCMVTTGPDTGWVPAGHVKSIPYDFEFD